MNTQMLESSILAFACGILLLLFVAALGTGTRLDAILAVAGLALALVAWYVTARASRLNRIPK